MKYILAKALLIIVLLVSFTSAYCSASKKDSIVLTAKIFNDDERVKGLIIVVYSHNKIIKKQAIKNSSFFKVYLPKDDMLTIEITAPDFHTKRVLFDTHLPKSVKRIPGYKFDMDIFSEKELEGVNTSFLDFPAGLIKYNPKKGVFLRDKAYTKRMKKAYGKLFEEAVPNSGGILEDSE